MRDGRTGRPLPARLQPYADPTTVQFMFRTPHQEQVVERRQRGADDQRAGILQRADERLQHAGALRDGAARRHRRGQRRRLFSGAQPRLQALQRNDDTRQNYGIRSKLTRSQT